MMAEIDGGTTKTPRSNEAERDTEYVRLCTYPCRSHSWDCYEKRPATSPICQWCGGVIDGINDWRCPVSGRYCRAKES